METVMVSLVSTALVIISAVTMIMSIFSSTNAMADSWKQMELQASEIRQTEITAIAPNDYAGGLINLTIRNDGQANIDDFPSWDIIAQRQNGNGGYIVYTDNTTPGSNQWTVSGIYLSDNSSEIFDPDILNPGEQMQLLINLNPAISVNETARITAATPNGVKAQCMLTRH